ncbi:MAG: penicillin-binding protein 2 [Chloroflexi bacterium]|nr:penicillin-binding protein 2 [Chloroflexota bacterium]
MIVENIPIKRRTSLTPPPDNQGGRARLLLMGIGMLIAFGLLVVRLYDLQINFKEDFVTEARENSEVTHKISASRGLIYDRNGVPLVRNAPAFQIAIIPIKQPRSDNSIEQRMQRMTIYNQLAQMINQPGVTAGDIYTKVYNASIRPYDSVVVAENVPRDIALTIQEQSLEMPGVVVESVGSRAYPYKELFGNIIGFTGKIPEETKDEYDKKFYESNDRVGLAGIEYSVEEAVRGIKGEETVLVDASGEELGTVGDPIPPQEGNGVRLTIDLRLQQIISDALLPIMQLRNSPRGAVVALNPNTGEVLGMVTVPGYDNNMFARGITQKEYEALQDNIQRPLINHATSDNVPPGSTFKIVTSAALLEEHAVDENTVINDPGTFRIPDLYDPDNPNKGQQFYCWINLSTGGGHGAQRIRDAIRNSCDTFFYKAVGGYAQEGIDGMGPEKLAQWAQTFGISETNKLEIGGGNGFAPTPLWKRNTYGEVWTTGDSYNFAIGQGYLGATPLEMANVMATIANGGTLLQPQLIREVVDNQGKVIQPFQPKVVRKLPISDATLRLIQQSLFDVVDQGTGVESKIPGFNYAGKTGTAEFCDFEAVKTGVCYNGMEYLPTHAWFLAYAPYENPQIALAVYIWNGGQGSGVAAPVAQRILANYFNVPLEHPKQVETTRGTSE